MARIIHTYPNHEKRHEWKRKQSDRFHHRPPNLQDLEWDTPRKQTPKRQRISIDKPVENRGTSEPWRQSSEDSPPRATKIEPRDDEEPIGNGSTAEIQVESQNEEERRVTTVRLSPAMSLSSNASEVDRQVERELMAAMYTGSAVFANTYPSHIEPQYDTAQVGDGKTAEFKIKTENQGDHIATMELIPAVPADTEANQAKLQFEHEQIATTNPDAALSANPSPYQFLSLEKIIAADFADQPRIEWSWRTPTQGKSKEQYTPTVMGKWWSASHEELLTLKPSKRSDRGHIGRIMETNLGVQFTGDARCSGCIARDWECWAYSERGRQQVSRPGDACARCRLVPSAGGCSLSKRRHKKKYTPPPLGFNRVLQPRIPVQFNPAPHH